MMTGLVRGLPRIAGTGSQSKGSSARSSRHPVIPAQKRLVAAVKNALVHMAEFSMVISVNAGLGDSVECSFCSLRAANTIPNIQRFFGLSGSSPIKALRFHQHQLCATGFFLFPLLDIPPKELMQRGRCSKETTAEKDRLWRLFVAAAGPTRPPTSSTVDIGDLKPGFVCAALFISNGQPLWHRAVVKRTQALQVLMFSLDYDTTMSVKVAGIKRIRVDSLELPTEAIKAWLTGVNAKNEEKSTLEPKQRFLQLVQMGEYNCSIVYEEEDSFVVQLLTSDDIMEDCLSDGLIYEDLAVSAIVMEEISRGSSI